MRIEGYVGGGVCPAIIMLYAGLILFVCAKKILSCAAVWLSMKVHVEVSVTPMNTDVE